MYLETERMILRTYRQEDFEDYCAYIIGDEERGRMMLTDPIYTVEEARDAFDWKLNRETERWYAMCLKDEGGKVVGGITIHPVPEEWAARPELLGKRGVSLSYSTAPLYRRRGLMEEAVRAMIDYLFREEDIQYINCGYMDYNLPSGRMLEKLGFTYFLTDTFEMDGTQFTSIETVLQMP